MGTGLLSGKADEMQGGNLAMDQHPMYGGGGGGGYNSSRFMLQKLG